MQALSQLSYTPPKEARIIGSRGGGVKREKFPVFALIFAAVFALFVRGGGANFEAAPGSRAES